MLQLGRTGDNPPQYRESSAGEVGSIGRLLSALKRWIRVSNPTTDNKWMVVEYHSQNNDTCLSATSVIPLLPYRGALDERGT